MKIVYCILGTFNSGGMERVLANKANYLATQGHELIIVTTDQKDRNSYFEMDNRISMYDLAINYAGTEKNTLGRLLSYPGKQWMHRKRLSTLLKSLKADVVVSMFDHDASFLYKLKDGSKKMLEIHFSRYKRLQYGRRGIRKLIDQFRSRTDLDTAKKYDSFVVLTHEDKGYWGDLPNINVIPNSNSFIPQAQAPLLEKKVIAVGRYDYQKGFDELIQAWKHVYKVHPDWSLSIFGQGPLADGLQNLINDLGLQGVVFLRAPVKNIENEYLSSSILAMTSRYEGLPMALLEGQVCGLPLVSYACKCGPKDIIRDGENGFLLREGDQAELARKLIHLMDDTGLRVQMGQNSRLLSSNYAEDLIMHQWLSLFKQITSKDVAPNKLPIC
ncbi:glycosyl transferase family 1 [Pedobacter antarcticus 4BY]|uniref:Glycosyl transferase family 1 n=2 Tax=Pedobacter antarcticus TaxID=34086 RepID=A0A081PBW4_9SPHI|nr:glycosyltransferase family 4 protein [Pedobacter antarcticus]KEQ28187.1 glycosyl transferase family 1 [Pedobacter antarcticus 4BY]SFE44749.1 Glycosyltransferase involved in cell wall bisynthesis [Pedobacter antarcticus]